MIADVTDRTITLAARQLHCKNVRAANEKCTANPTGDALCLQPA